MHFRENDTGETHCIPQGDGGRRRGRPLDAHALQFGDAPSREGGSGASQTYRANLRFLGRRVRGVFPGEGADGGEHSCRGVVESRSHPSARWKNPSLEQSRRGARLHPRNHFTARARVQDLNPCHRSLKVLRRVREDPDVHATATKQAS